MNIFRIFSLLLIICFIACDNKADQVSSDDTSCTSTQGALLGTRFPSFEALREAIKIEYKSNGNAQAHIRHSCNGNTITSIIKSGVSEKDFDRAWEGGILDRLRLVFLSPYFVIHRNDLLRIYLLSRRKEAFFSEGDISFYDIAEAMMHHIDKADSDSVNAKDFSEKGYINSFNHLTAQALVTSIFSEDLADFIADTHERARMPEIVTGQFTESQLKDLENGPVDNYVDIINNEWGQELGKRLRIKYSINRTTKWTPELLKDYLNDIQSYCSWAFQIAMKPFRVDDEMIYKFSNKINRIMDDVSKFS